MRCCRSSTCAACRAETSSNPSPSVLGRLKEEWTSEYDRWQRRDLSARRYVYIWADGVYLQARMEDSATCMLVVIGATPEGHKELVGFQVDVRKSAQSWRELLVDLKARGLAVAPEIAVGGGALGRERVRDGAAPDRQDQGRAVAHDRPPHGFEARHGRVEKLAAPERGKSVAAGHPGASCSPTTSPSPRC